jgi:hypothetical protein
MSNGDTIYYRIFKNFQSLQRECVSLSNSIYSFSKNSANTIHLTIWDPYEYPIDLKHPELPVAFQLAFIQKGNMETMTLKLPDNISALTPGDTLKIDCQFPIGDLPAGKYKIVVCSETGILYNTYSSNFSEAVISD